MRREELTAGEKIREANERLSNQKQIARMKEIDCTEYHVIGEPKILIDNNGNGPNLVRELVSNAGNLFEATWLIFPDGKSIDVTNMSEFGQHAYCASAQILWMKNEKKND